MSLQDRIHIQHGDAVNHLKDLYDDSIDEDKDDDSSGRKYNVILSVDAAYHFHPSRKLFWSHAFNLLKSGGRIGAVDMCLTSNLQYLPFLSRMLLTLLLASVCMPAENR